ncbi:MAG: hypothetical protein QOE54_7160 [Streptosporangiaceae bacterium]|jgi:isopenicillin N synthase-like dioxygenase|nr:2OG-Fe(II) oxygenase [Streptosporangiaceae bacterium]MDX6434794.1 hypothetical protein [Streptosporangiaceae bacterium]
MSMASSVDGALNVPIIDISAFRTGMGRREVASAVDRAARDVGFMQIVGHGVPERAEAGLATAMDAFFGLPLADKKAVRPESAAVNRGYTPPKTERLSHSLGIYSSDDLFEAFNVGTQASDFPDLSLDAAHYPANLWPSGPPGFQRAVEDWFRHAGVLARTMTRIFACALELPADFFVPYEDHSIDVLRMNNYQVPERDLRLEPGQLGMGAHTDYGIVTVLWADAAPGLQILDTGGHWHDVIPVPGALLINLGDLLARWTGDRWISTMHRVLAPVSVDGRVFRRRSAAYFHDGNADAVITTLPGRTASYEPVTVADHLAAKLAGSRGLELNPEAAREAARLRAAVT